MGFEFMKVGIDIRMLHASGIGTTIQGLLRCFSKEQMQQVELLGPRDFETPLEHDFEHVDAPVYGLKQHWSYGPLLNKKQLSLYHMPHYDVPFSYSGRLVVTVHDIIHVLFPEYSTKPFSRLYANWMLRRSASRAQKIICVSENTQKDLWTYFPSSQGKTVVINPAVGPEFYPVEEPVRLKTIRKFHLPDNYLLYVGNLRGSKNSWNLVQGYLDLKRQKPEIPSLVLVGKNFYPEWDKASPGPGVYLLGAVEKEELVHLYSGAALFVFPSLYEGFGLPPLEAMACGIPVLTSHVAALPEVCGEAAEYLLGFSPEVIARGINQLLESPQRLRVMKEKGFENLKRFSWETFSQKTWAVYEEVTGCD